MKGTNYYIDDEPWIGSVKIMARDVSARPPAYWKYVPWNKKKARKIKAKKI